MKLILLIFFSTSVFANGVIFKNSFENEVFISGTVSGLNSTGLKLRINMGFNIDFINVDDNGSFVFPFGLAVGQVWSVVVAGLPSTPQQSCEISNNSGTAAFGSGNDVLVVCNTIPWKWNEMNWDEGGWQ